jgi:hypothetical protein
MLIPLIRFVSLPTKDVGLLWHVMAESLLGAGDLFSQSTAASDHGRETIHEFSCHAGDDARPGSISYTPDRAGLRSARQARLRLSKAHR